MSCQIAIQEINGWRAVRLSNSRVAVTVLPDKGADIYSLVDLASGIDVLFKSPWGLQPPGSEPRAGSGLDGFLQNYEGGWQELFPNTGPTCTYRGQAIPLHGEVATLPWKLEIERDDVSDVRIKLTVQCQKLPLLLSRRMALSRGSPVLRIDEIVQNLSDESVSFVWGHHPVIGAPLLEAGSRLRVGSCTVHTPHAPFDPANASYASAQVTPWPLIRSIGGGEVDLSVIPGPDANTHDHASLTDFDQGWIEIENPRLKLAFSLEWDPTVFRWINNWRPFGGSHQAPLEGIYGMGLEPWATRANLADAMTADDALTLQGGGRLDTWVRAAVRSTGV